MARKQYDLLFKLLLIGDSGVGKTCILYRFSDDAFNTTFISTIGIDFKIKTIELRGKKIKLQIWDTAGQERFHTITTSYYRGAMGIMLVYDITNARSFDNIAKWLRNIDEVCEGVELYAEGVLIDHYVQHASEDVVKMLLGNKCDMADRRVVSKERGERIAVDHGIRFLETSAKANINVDRAFYELAEAILDRVLLNAQSTNYLAQQTPPLFRCLHKLPPTPHDSGQWSKAKAAQEWGVANCVGGENSAQDLREIATKVPVL